MISTFYLVLRDYRNFKHHTILYLSVSKNGNGGSGLVYGYGNGWRFGTIDGRGQKLPKETIKKDIQTYKSLV
jgi:hypothetical protein